MLGCFAGEVQQSIDYVYSAAHRQALKQRMDMLDETVCRANLDAMRDQLRDVEVICCTWNMTQFTEEELAEYFPKLKLVLYSAASVRYFAEPFLKRGVKILSAWGAMAVPVAEFTLATILHANKGFYLSMDRYRKSDFRTGKDLAQKVCPGTYGTNVGIIGAGMIGKLVIKMLKNHRVNIKVFDPFLPQSVADELGVELTTLEDLFESCQTITNHLANNPQTEGMLNYDLFRRMNKCATFINTGRGAQVVEEDLVRALREEPDRCAVLDVTWPEPCPKDHPFWELPNVFMTPHIAGYAKEEVHCMPDCMLEEFDRYLRGEPNVYEVTLPMLATMA